MSAGLERWMFATILIVACGAPARPGDVPQNEAPPVAEEDPIAVARALATALRTDGGIGGLVDPEEGAWIWTQPGAYSAPTWHVAAGSSASLWAMGEDLGLEEHWLWDGFARD